MDSMTAPPTSISVRPAEPADAPELADLLSRNRDYFRTGEPKRRSAPMPTTHPTPNAESSSRPRSRGAPEPR